MMIDTKRKTSRFLSIIVAAALLLSPLPFSAYAAELNIPKEEVVYINLNGDGSIKEINVVNIWMRMVKSLITDVIKVCGI